MWVSVFVAVRLCVYEHAYVFMWVGWVGWLHAYVAATVSENLQALVTAVK